MALGTSQVILLPYKSLKQKYLLEVKSHRTWVLEDSNSMFDNVFGGSQVFQIAFKA